MRRRDKNFKVKKASTQFNMVSRSNRSCVRPREKGKTLLNFGGVQ